MSAILQQIDPHDIDEEERQLQVASVLDGTDDDERDTNILASGHNEEEDGGYGSLEKRAMLKMLVSDSAAGAIIGKSGSTIADLQAQSNARIKVSQSSDFYPGSSERVVLITGSVKSVILGQELIWEKIVAFTKPRHNNVGIESDLPSRVQGKILIPNDAGGLLIGRAGTTIKAIQEECGARVQINSKDELDSRLTKERVLTISGPQSACVQCTELIIRKLQEDPSITYQNKTTTYSRTIGMRGDRNDGSTQLRFNLPEGAETVSATSTVTINVPDTLVGFVLGKRGAVIAEIQQLSGAKVVISPREEAKANGEPMVRVITITGTPNSAQVAQLLISQKLQLANSRHENSANPSRLK